MTSETLSSTMEVETLIQEIKKMECLWNAKNGRYQDKYRRKSWKDIARKLNVKVETAKSKWKNMRDIFRRELKNHNNADPQEYQGKWRYYEQMWFVRGFMHAGRRRATEDDHEQTLKDNEVSFMKCEPFAEGEPFVEDEPEENEEETNKIYFEDNHDDFDGVLAKKHKPNDDEDDYDMMYLKSLLPFFKTLDPMRKLVVRTRIQDMLLNEMSAAQKGKKN